MTGLTSHLQSALADRCRIAREPGAGGGATVYLAEDLKHDRKVAVKVLATPDSEGRVDIAIRPVRGPARILVRAGVAGGEAAAGIHGVPAAGGSPRLLVRFDDPARPVLTTSVPERNGRFDVSVGGIESDTYLMDLVPQ